MSIRWLCFLVTIVLCSNYNLAYSFRIYSFSTQSMALFHVEGTNTVLVCHLLNTQLTQQTLPYFQSFPLFILIIKTKTDLSFSSL